MQENTQPQYVNVFVYGTLRVGQPLAHLLRGSVVGCSAASVEGFVLHSNRGRSYPYLLHGEGVVQGDLYTCRLDRALMDVCAMEQGAGYDIEEVEVTIAGGEKLPAIAFVLSNRHHRWLGQRIASGDWVQFVTRMQRKAVKSFSSGPIVLEPNRG